MKKIQVYICCHKDCAAPSDSIFTPIHAGAALTDKKLNMLRDDSGDNISNKNRFLNELTIIYWAWKNDNADYVGLMHYRRHFSFKLQDIFKVDEFTNYYQDFIDEFYYDEIGLRDYFARPIIEQHPIIMPLKYNVFKCRHKFANNYDHYKKIPEWFVLDDYNLALEILSQKYPDMIETANEYNKCEEGYYCNMFIMRRDIFDKYAAYLFDIVFEMESRIDLSNRSKQKSRGIAFCAEWLTAIFVVHYSKIAQVKPLELARTFVKNTNYINHIYPAFIKNNIPIVYRCDGIDLVSVSIASVIRNSHDQYNYDIIVLYTACDSASQAKIEGMVLHKNNISVRYIDISYYRAKLPNEKNDVFIIFSELFKDYEKVISLADHVVITHDVADLYSIPIYVNASCAVVDYALINLAKKKHTVEFLNAKLSIDEYLQKYLNIKSILKYFSFDVSVYNLKFIRESLDVEEFVHKKMNTSFVFDSNDNLNFFLNGNVKEIDVAWNLKNYFLNEDNCTDLPYTLHNSIKQTLYSHFAVNFSDLKMCISPSTFDFINTLGSHIFFEAARYSPVYEKILTLYLQNHNNYTLNAKSNNVSYDFFSKIITPELSIYDRILARIFKRKFEQKIILKSRAFDKAYYLSQYPDVAQIDVDPIYHYVHFGVVERRNPSPYFDTAKYLEMNKDVMKNSFNPLVHFILHGKNERRAF